MADRDVKELSARLGAALSARSLTIAVAESCTGGELCAAITSVPGSSAWFPGGIVAYDNAVKSDALAVPQELIAARGAVSREVAERMADGVRQRFGAGIGLATTGIAGPGGGSPAKPVGTVHIGVSFAGRLHVQSLSLPGDRETVRRQTVLRALEAALLAISGGGRSGG